MWELAIIGKPPMNRNARDKAHWATAQRERKDFTNRIGFLALARKIPKAEARRAVSIVIVKPRAIWDDADNLIARAKPLLDSLKLLELIVDDNPEWLEFNGDSITQEKGERYATRIRLWDAPMRPLGEAA